MAAHSLTTLSNIFRDLEHELVWPTGLTPPQLEQAVQGGDRAQYGAGGGSVTPRSSYRHRRSGCGGRSRVRWYVTCLCRRRAAGGAVCVGVVPPAGSSVGGALCRRRPLSAPLKWNFTRGRRPLLALPTSGSNDNFFFFIFLKPKQFPRLI